MKPADPAECKDPAEHARHICQLRKQGQTDVVTELMKSPGHTCLNCNAVANDFRHLCNPSSFSRA